MRPGYRITPRLSFELLAGYLHLRGRVQRELRARNTDPEPIEFEASVRDETRLSAPLMGFGAAYRLLKDVPLIARLSTGAARARVRTAVGGRFRATIPHPEYPDDRAVDYTYDEHAGAVDEPQTFWAPFIAPEIRVGHTLGRHVTVDLGVAGWFVFAPSYSRTTGVLGEPEDRLVFLPEPREGDGYRLDGRSGTPFVKPGIVRLPRESAVGPMFIITPSVAVRASF